MGCRVLGNLAGFLPLAAKMAAAGEVADRKCCCMYREEIGQSKTLDQLEDREQSAVTGGIKKQEASLGVSRATPGLSPLCRQTESLWRGDAGALTHSR